MKKGVNSPFSGGADEASPYSILEGMRMKDISTFGWTGP